MLKFFAVIIISALFLIGILWLAGLNPQIPTMKTTDTYQPPLKIAVLSDTHIPSRAARLPEKFLKRLEKEKPDLLLHAGDLVNQATIDKLEEFAPLKAVAGNMDPKSLGLPKSRAIKVGKYKIGIIHNTLNPLSHKMVYTAQENNLDLIIFGHTHRKVLEKKEGIWFLNPGSPTDPKLQKPSFGLIQIKKDRLESKIITLD